MKDGFETGQAALSARTPGILAKENKKGNA
jgi:hypothetical protein